MSFRDYLGFALGAIVFFLLVPYIEWLLGQSLYIGMLPRFWTIKLAGAITACLGVVLTLFSIYELAAKGKGGAFVIGKFRVSKQTSHLVTTGPYALCRNPMHFGLTLFYLGLAICINSLTCIIIPIGMWIFALLFAVCLDEPRLQRDFKTEYMQWARQVPRFWPGIRNIKRRQENRR